MTRIRVLTAVATMAAVTGLSVLAAQPGLAQPTAQPGLAQPAAPHATARTSSKPDAGIAFPLHTSGASIVDADNNPVKLNLVNWYGAESPDYVAGGLAYQPISDIISKIVSMGFNGVRLPWSNQMWESNPVVSDTYLKANTQFDGETADTIFEKVVQDLASAGLMVVLDNHTSNAEWCCSATDGNTLWYNSSYPQSAWVADWKAMATEFKSVPQVIGVDLRNEPRGAATWGGSAADDWQAAATTGGDAVQSVDPNLLVFVEGINYAGDLSGVSSLPVTLTDASHVVYEAHEYGYWHSGVSSYDQWVSDIGSDWGYMVGKYPLWIGEFGTCNTADSCVSSTDSSDLGLWFAIFTRYLDYHNVNWSYWAVNGTESDGLPGQGRTYGDPETYGIMNTSWDGAANADLLSTLQGIQPSCPAGALANGTYYIKNSHSGDVIDIPGFKTANGTDLDQWPLNNGTNQQWKVTGLGCGLYEITSVLDGSSIDIYDQSTASGSAVDEWSYWGGGNQQFVVAKDSAGSYTIASINSMDDVEVPGSSTTAGTALDQGTPGGAADQEWTFSPA
jgi:endoglucanase